MLAADFGKGWMSSSAADLCKIAVAFGGFDVKEVVLEIHRIQRSGAEKVNAATVERALGNIKRKEDRDEALAGTSPNGRDYYVQAGVPFPKAVDEHRSRIERLKTIDAEIMALWENVQAQEDERQERKREALRR